ncbi:MAG: transposase [bacterium]
MIWDDHLARLLTIPGIGYISALTILAEIDDIHRFPSHKVMGD